MSRPLKVKNADVEVGKTFSLNFKQGSNVTIDVTEDIPNQHIDVEIAATSGSGSPGGSNTQIQFNDSGSFGGDAELTYNKTTNVLTVDTTHQSTIQAHSSAGVVIEATGGADCALFGAGGGQNVTFYDGVKLDASTASRVLGTDASKNITALDTATYPDLTELSYVKGVTSAIQTQLNGKQASDQQLTDIAALSYASNSLKVVRVNAGETAFELATISAGGLEQYQIRQMIRR